MLDLGTFCLLVSKCVLPSPVVLSCPTLTHSVSHSVQQCASGYGRFTVCQANSYDQSAEGGRSLLPCLVLSCLVLSCPVFCYYVLSPSRLSMPIFQRYFIFCFWSVCFIWSFLLSCVVLCWVVLCGLVLCCVMLSFLLSCVLSCRVLMRARVSLNSLLGVFVFSRCLSR